MDFVFDDIITEIPPDFKLAEIRDFYNYDSKTRIKTYKIGIPFILKSFHTKDYSGYFVTEEWNDIDLIAETLDKPFIWSVKGIGNNKMLVLATFIQFNRCWVREIDKYKKAVLPPKPLTPSQIKAKKKKEIFHKVEF